MKNPSEQSVLLPQAQKALLNLNAFYTSGGQDLHALNSALAQAESLAIGLRTAYETAYRDVSAGRDVPAAPILRNAGGRISVNEYGWLHMELAMLLPHCQYKTPRYLIDTLERLLDGYAQHHQLPWFSKALLVIDEWSNIQNRRVYDQDNKGWKAIPNILKGRVLADDDQYRLEIALLSRQDEQPSCHIFILPAEDADAFFTLRSGTFGYPP
ncbi:MAG: hypothetical protein ACLUBZ_00080 [Ruthenibacterium lactatiformans]|uniref:hypothetical protein n=1 Tax=Ruthenibacterium lactatiformans TaxID=1550024 RepID=UPI00399418A0